MNQLFVVNTPPASERVCGDPELIATGQELDVFISAILKEVALLSESVSGEVCQGGAF
jgi:hypothetical protein